MLAGAFIRLFIRVFLGLAAVAAEFFIAPVDPRFGVVQFIISVVLFAAVVVALWLVFRWPRE